MASSKFANEQTHCFSRITFHLVGYQQVTLCEFNPSVAVSQFLESRSQFSVAGAIFLANMALQAH
jgi:hypothetical protein